MIRIEELHLDTETERCLGLVLHVQRHLQLTVRLAPLTLDLADLDDLGKLRIPARNHPHHLARRDLRRDRRFRALGGTGYPVAARGEQKRTREQANSVAERRQFVSLE